MHTFLRIRFTSLVEEVVLGFHVLLWVVASPVRTATQENSQPCIRNRTHREVYAKSTSSASKGTRS
jgi:hypothetical protein